MCAMLMKGSLDFINISNFFSVRIREEPLMSIGPIYSVFISLTSKHRRTRLPVRGCTLRLDHKNWGRLESTCPGCRIPEAAAVQEAFHRFLNNNHILEGGEEEEERTSYLFALYYLRLNIAQLFLFFISL